MTEEQWEEYRTYIRHLAAGEYEEADRILLQWHEGD